MIELQSSGVLVQTFTSTALLIATFVVVYFLSAPRSVKVPRVGYRWFTLARDGGHADLRGVLSEGYRKFPNSSFKIRVHPFGTVTVLANKKLVNELRTAPDEVFDFTSGGTRSFLPNYTLSPLIIAHRNHVPIIRDTLTRNLNVLFEDIMDEMKHSFEHNIVLSGQEWKSFPAHSTMMSIICRTSNRVIIGLPFCRNPEYCAMNITFTVDIFETADKINYFPEFLHPIVGPLISKSKSYQNRILKIIGPEIKRRIEMLDKYGPDWADKPNDYLMWIIENETGPLRHDLYYLAVRVLEINFAAIHTSSMAFTHALFYLCIYPEYVEILREEASAVIKEEGEWSKTAMRKMRKGDSFLRECARVNPLGSMALMREAKKDHTFSNGLTIPKGNFACTSLHSVHQDENIYEDASEFKPWRFADVEGGDKEGLGSTQYIETSPEFLVFGYGKHACPGRFFAVNELKALLAYVVLNYDVQLEGNSKERPSNFYSRASIIPNPFAKVMFRKRSSATTR